MSNRREFIKKSSKVIAGAGVLSAFPFSSKAAKSLETDINIGVIGLGFGFVNMQQMLKGTPSVRCAALCDIDKNRLTERSEALKKEYPEQTKGLKLYSDFRELIADESIDGVIIATPDHWHTYIYAEASKAGKAIYIEKPTGHTIADCNLMVDLQKENKNVVSTGLWHISLPYFIEAFEILRSGVLGDVNKVHAWITKNEKVVTYKVPQKAPEGFDYEMWQGSAKPFSYAKERIDNWRFFWDYGGGRQGDWLHYLDSAFDGLQALGYERAYPKSVSSVGYKKQGTMLEAPDGQTSVFEFDNYHVVWEHQVTQMYNRGDGVAWIGSKGTLVCNRMGYEIIPEKIDGKNAVEPVKVQGGYGNQYNHMINWAKCIKEKNTNTNSPISKGSFVSEVSCIANIAYRVGRSLEYNPEKQKFNGDKEANAYIKYKYHNGWKYPTV